MLFSCVVWFVAPMLALLDHADLCSYSCESYIPHPPPTCRKHPERVIGIDIKVQEDGLPITGLKLSSRFVPHTSPCSTPNWCARVCVRACACVCVCVCVCVCMRACE